MNAHNEGRDVMAAINKGTDLALKKAYENDCDEEAISLARASKIVRKDMLQPKAKFTRSFEPDCWINCSTITVGAGRHGP